MIEISTPLETAVNIGQYLYDPIEVNRTPLSADICDGVRRGVFEARYRNLETDRERKLYMYIEFDGGGGYRFVGLSCHRVYLSEVGLGGEVVDAVGKRVQAPELSDVVEYMNSNPLNIAKGVAARANPGCKVKGTYVCTNGVVSVAIVDADGRNRTVHVDGQVIVSGRKQRRGRSEERVRDEAVAIESLGVYAEKARLVNYIKTSSGAYVYVTMPGSEHELSIKVKDGKACGISIKGYGKFTSVSDFAAKMKIDPIKVVADGSTAALEAQYGLKNLSEPNPLIEEEKRLYELNTGSDEIEPSSLSDDVLDGLDGLIDDLREGLL